MEAPITQLPEHIRNAFHAPDEEPQRLGAWWDYGWKVGSVVFAQAPSPNRAVWSARVREKLEVEHLRISRPIRSTDSRFINAGWRATTFIEGEPAARADEVVAAALRLDAALAHVALSDALRDVDASDPFSVADHAAWSRDPAAAVMALFGQGAGERGFEATQRRTRRSMAMRMVDQLAPRLVELDAEVQVCHADMLATTVFQGAQVPGVCDIVGVARPYGYSAALAAFDSMVMQASGEAIVQRFAHVEHFAQMVARAAIYRLVLHGIHPEANSNSSSKLEQTCTSLIRGGLPQ
ncbi:TIGR02569 family protein [Corynebacterium pelargi]|uniref:Uncharacterized protein n=1 Tax=Corynebacterium pelargi TaxID=1471400 RepID=A0A410WAD4_9CORY|nr:TIGR02569 family protein [Corynebacterium pelargi]QAU52905.1 hypothetical protein CPELA_08250 [Corynebacterium pelargi]GGG76117.1 TIGR02569 family protein [Corynebacterium pelargi]